MVIPDFLQSCLWSYDLSQLDPKKDYRLIITQILNYGNQQAINWLNANYPQSFIEEVVRRPQRGVWFREKLRRGLAIFNILIDPLDFEASIRDLKPRLKLLESVLDRRTQTLL